MYDIKPCKRVSWNEIKVGDIFVEDVWGYDVFEKRSNTSARFIASTTGNDYSGVTGHYLGDIIPSSEGDWDDSTGLYYKLSKSTQNKFKGESCITI